MSYWTVWWQPVFPGGQDREGVVSRGVWVPVTLTQRHTRGVTLTVTLAVTLAAHPGAIA
ncbi:hypothetical protein GCM10010346_66140 [Streptomyces chryseus]|uniref:Uncharacterized protein n=1 Tax=Streptomyces chryseus TaxID=68186 RepID=A0ABQ3ED56_9ACTN|nr:hypothetical protein GCM10010346_66140 [Streptomyces chryseus]